MSIPDVSGFDEILVDLEEQRVQVQAWKDAVLRTATITCAEGHTHEIGKLTYIQTHWYVEPHGCTGGDYWNEGEGLYRCPDCEGVWRLFRHPEIMQLKRLFKDVEKTYDR